MSTTVQQVIDRARGEVHDRADSHFGRDFLTEQATGTTAVFLLRNRNVLQLADGAPTDLTAFVNGAPVAITSVDQITGLVTLTASPAQLSQVEMRYWYVLNTNTEFLDFVRAASNFVGAPATFTALTDNVQFQDLLVEAAVKYAASLASRSMASLAHWYYSANAGQKSFNKDQISAKFSKQADDLEAAARKVRMDVYQRFDAVDAPAYKHTAYRGMGYWEPPR